MILRELFYFDKKTVEVKQDDRYESSRDTDALQDSDTRKTRLTLSQINELRKASELHIKEKEAELEFITRMYAMPVEQS